MRFLYNEFVNQMCGISHWEGDKSAATFKYSHNNLASYNYSMDLENVDDLREMIHGSPKEVPFIIVYICNPLTKSECGNQLDGIGMCTTNLKPKTRETSSLNDRKRYISRFGSDYIEDSIKTSETM